LCLISNNIIRLSFYIYFYIKYEDEYKSAIYEGYINKKRLYMQKYKGLKQNRSKPLY